MVTHWSGYRCPVDPAHGRLLDGRDGARNAYYCPHQDHDGRPSTHPLGPSLPTRAFFTLDEAERGSLTEERNR